MPELLMMRCKGPGGYVEVFCDVDDVTGELLSYRIAAEPGAKLRALSVEKGTRRELARELDETGKTIAATPGQFAVKKDGQITSVPWGLSLESP